MQLTFDITAYAFLMPTQKLKIRFSMFCSQEIGSSLVSFEMIFKLYNLNYLNSSFIRLVKNLENPGIQPNHTKIYF